MVRKLLSRAFDEEAPLADTIASAMAKETGLPPYEYPTANNVTKIGSTGYVYVRNLLANRARDRLSQRAGGQWLRVTLTDGDERLALDTAEHVLNLERALARLEQHDERAARVVELRYFAGLSLEQVATTLQLARRTVDRDWSFARAFLEVEFGSPA